MKTSSAWRVSAQEALTTLTLAIDEAMAEVPEEIRTEQWVAAKHMMQASAWEEMSLQHRQPLYTALRMLSIAKAALEAAVEEEPEQPQPPPDLRCGRMRH